MDCARYDGDMNHAERRKELERFKADQSCRVLLSTVHVCGTGLNIVQANHVFFVDRWFNPTVHDQAMDRCYRIGQKRDVFVSFFDCLGTMDVGMMLMNRYKRENSAILLADGSELGDGNVSFRQLNGMMRHVLMSLSAGRSRHVEALDATTPLRRDDTMLEMIMERLAEISKNPRRRYSMYDDEDDYDY